MHTLNDSDQPLSYVCKNVLVESQSECLVESGASGLVEWGGALLYCDLIPQRGFDLRRGLKGGIGTDRNNRGYRVLVLKDNPSTGQEPEPGRLR